MMEESREVAIGQTGAFKGIMQGRLGRYRPVTPEEVESIRSIAARHIDRIVSGHAETRGQLEFVDAGIHQWKRFDETVATPFGLQKVTKTLKSRQM